MKDKELIAVGILHHVPEITGRELREQMNSGRSWWFRFCNSGPAFYHLMSRLEDKGKVVGWYRQSEEFPEIRERWYKLRLKTQSEE